MKEERWPEGEGEEGSVGAEEGGRADGEGEKSERKPGAKAPVFLSRTFRGLKAPATSGFALCANIPHLRSEMWGTHS